MKQKTHGNCFPLFSMVIFSLLVLTSCHEAEKVYVNKVEGKYHYLYVEKSAFDTLPTFNPGADRRGNLYLRYFLEGGFWNMHGWVWRDNNPNNNQFREALDIGLQVGDPSNVDFGDGSYFGDFVIQKKHIKDIKDSLVRRGHNIVVFVPFIDPADNNIFKWKLATSDTIPVHPVEGGASIKSELKKIVDPGLMFQSVVRYEETGYLANPIPPKKLDPF